MVQDEVQTTFFGKFWYFYISFDLENRLKVIKT